MGGRTGPTLNNCRPLDCANTALTSDNITALSAELDRLTTELDTRPSLPPLLQHRLRERRHQIHRFLDRHQPEATP